MLKGVLFGIILLFTLIGIVCALYRMMISLLHPKSAGKYAVIIRLDDDTPDPAGLIYAARIRTELSGEFGKCAVIAVDNGLDENKRKQCELFCKSCVNTEICSNAELCKIIDKAWEA